MRRAAAIYDLARGCYDCHLVADERLTDNGHSRGHDDFEFAAWANGEVQHNFLLGAEVDAAAPANHDTSSLALHYAKADTAGGRLRRLYVIGQIAELEATLGAYEKILRRRSRTLDDVRAQRQRLTDVRVADDGPLALQIKHDADVLVGLERIVHARRLGIDSPTPRVDATLLRTVTFTSRL